MLNKKMFSTMFLLSALFVGCSSTNDFSDDKVKNNKEKVEVVEEQKEQKACLCFTVTDTGIGMGQEQLDKLFQEFT